MQRRSILVRGAFFLLILTASAPLTAQRRPNEEIQKRQRDEKQAAKHLKAAELPGVIRRDSDDVRNLSLFYGAGGREHAPNPNGRYTFLKEGLKGTNPKFDVEDGDGVRWRVKLDSDRRFQPERYNEPQAETAASRLLWAAGYFVDEDYYMTDLTVTGLPSLHRGQRFVSADGRVHGIR